MIEEDIAERCVNDISDKDIEKIQIVLDKISLSTEALWHIR